VSTVKAGRKPSAKPTKDQLKALVEHYEGHREQFDLFRRQVVDYFSLSKRLTTGPLPIVHSVKSRLKDPEHLREKIIRKWKIAPISHDALFSSITDLAGVRVLHLYSRQFVEIHTAIKDQVDRGNWSLHESPVAYSWDPEATAFFKSLGLRAEERDS